METASTGMALCLAYLGNQTWKSEMVNEYRKNMLQKSHFVTVVLLEIIQIKIKLYSVHIFSKISVYSESKIMTISYE